MMSREYLMKVWITPLLICSMSLLCPSYEAVAQTGSLRVTVTDAASGKAVPARLEVQAVDGSYVVASDALPYAGDCTMSKPNAGLLDDAASVQLFSKRAVLENPYTKSTQFYTAGESTLSISAGKTRIRVFKGPEYHVGEAIVEVPASGDIAIQIDLKRWIDMPKRGWYSADDHLHIPRPSADHNDGVSKMMQAEDVHVANLLQMGKVGDFTIAEQYAHGPESHYQHDHYILASGQENPRTHFLGHTITLGAAKTHFNSEQYLLYRLIWEETVKEGAINGFAHAVFPYGSFIAPHDGIAVVLPHKLMHFLEVLQFDRHGYDVWYDLLALGLRITPTAGTDYPCGGQVIPGHERFYTKVEGALTYEKWIASVKAGRTFVTTGPVVEFSVDGQDIGSTVSLDKQGTVEITGRVMFNAARDDITFVELIHNGHVFERVSRVGNEEEISFSTSLHIERGAWLAARGFGVRLDELPFAEPLIFGTFEPNVTFHTAPVWVTVENRPALAQGSEAKRVAREYRARLVDIERVLGEDNLDVLTAKLERPTIDAVPGRVLRNNRVGLLKEIEFAKDYFQSIID